MDAGGGASQPAAVGTGASQPADLQRRQKTEELLQQVRDLGSYPKESAGRGLAERQLARKIREALKAKQFSPEQEAELQALQQAESDARAAAGIAEAEELPNPMEGFAEEAQSRIDQGLLMLESGIRTKALLRRLAVYKELVSSLSAQHADFAQQYAERVREALAATAGKSVYAPPATRWAGTRCAPSRSGPS